MSRRTFSCSTCLSTLELDSEGRPNEGLCFLVLELTRHVCGPTPVGRKAVKGEGSCWNLRGNPLTCR